jgi:hypothetical protein
MDRALRTISQFAGTTVDGGTSTLYLRVAERRA